LPTSEWKIEKNLEVVFMDKIGLIQTLRKEGFSDRIISAFEKVKREDFVSENLKKLAYENIALPITESETISQPSTIAISLSLLHLKENQKVLELGSGCGYVLALISEIVGEGGKVLGVEIVKKLADKSRENLGSYKNIGIFNKNGRDGLKEAAPFDRILISAALEEIPKEILKQLKEEGMIVAPIGSAFIQTLTSIKRENGDFVVKKQVPGFVFVRFVD